MGITKASSRYHQLSPSYNKRQNENISALVNVLDTYVSFNSETVQLQNIITGQLYSKEIFESLIAVEQLGNNLFHATIPVCYVIDDTAILNPKPTLVKQGADLAAAFKMSTILTQMAQQHDI